MTSYIFSLMSALLVLACGGHSYPQAGDAVGCRNEQGELVDTYILYKLPEDGDSDDPLVQEGSGYMYLSNDTDENLGWKMSKQSIASDDSFPGQTLNIIYNSDHQDELLYIAYNDEFPNGKKTESHGHTKGVVVMTPRGGYWLVHSTPRFPSAPEDGHYGYPLSGHTYGQSFLCISLPSSQAEDLGLQLQMNKPWIFGSLVSRKGSFPTLEDAIEGVSPPEDETFRVAKLRSQGGREFTVFSKYGTYGKDLYAGLVAPTLKTSDLFVETWRRGKSDLPADCQDQNRVENINEIEIGKETFKYTKDHSKWAVSDKDGGFVCIGDINRMSTQFRRGGGTVCQKDAKAWGAFRSIVKNSDNCNDGL